MGKYFKTSHSVYRCHYHLVLVSKYRRRIFNSGLFSFFQERMKGLEEHYPQIHFEAINHDEDHIHLLVSIAPQVAVGNAVRLIKSVSGRDMKRKFAFLKEVYWGADGIWSDGYFVDTVGFDEAAVKRYIELQGKEDAAQAELDL